MLPAVLVALLVLGSGVGVSPQSVGAGSPAETAAAGTPGGTAHPEIIEVYPNPEPPGDDGEFVTLWTPKGVTLDDYALTDGHVTVSLPSLENASESGQRTRSDGRLVTLSTNATVTATLTDRTTLTLSDSLQLANDGDHLQLLHNGTAVDEMRYGSATEGMVYDVDEQTWSPLGATDLSVTTSQGGTVEAFALPDAGGRAVDLLDSATDRILLTGYTLTAQSVVDALVTAHGRGVQVEVLVDSSPVGGTSQKQVTALDALDRAGVPVHVMGGDRARYRYQHAKYAVVDDRALVTTENWKPAGLGGQSSRGWGVITTQEPIVEGLVTTFQTDTEWVDTVPYSEFEPSTVVEAESESENYPTTFRNESLPVERTELLVAPDNAESRTLQVIDAAEQSIDIKQVAISDPQFPFLQAVLDAAARGVEVRILLSGAWYVAEENGRLQAWLEEQARADDLPLQVRIADPDGDFEKIHAKGMLVDGEQTLLGSMNWNNNSIRHNREVALLVDSPAVTEYFGEVFESDWGGDERQLPLGFVAVCLLVAFAALIAATRLQFD